MNKTCWVICAILFVSAALFTGGAVTFASAGSSVEAGLTAYFKSTKKKPVNDSLAENARIQIPAAFAPSPKVPVAQLFGDEDGVLRTETIPVIDATGSAVAYPGALQERQEEDSRTRLRDNDPLDQGADNCPATIIPSVPFTDAGTTAGQASDWNTADDCGYGATNNAPDVIYSFTPAVSAA